MPIVHDQAALLAARSLVRQAYRAVRALPQDDPTIRCIAVDLDDIAVGITVELEAQQPALEFGS